MRRLLLLFCAIALLGVPVAASAAVLSASAADPRDLPTSIDGTPSDADIEQVRVDYDDAQGALVATVRFHRPVSDFGIYRLSVSVGSADSQFGYCSSTSGAFMTTGVRSGSSASDGTVLVGGFTDGPPQSRIVSADGREITIWTSHPVLAGKAWTCADASTYLPDSDGHYSSVCGCIRYSYDHDDIDTMALGASGPGPLVLPSLPPAASPTTPPSGATPAPSRRCQRLPGLIRTSTRNVNRHLRAVRRARTTKGRRLAAKRLRVAREHRADLRREIRILC